MPEEVPEIPNFPGEVTGQGGGSEPFTRETIRGLAKSDLEELYQLIEGSKLNVTQAWMSDADRQDILAWSAAQEAQEEEPPARRVATLTRFDRVGCVPWMEGLDRA